VIRLWILRYAQNDEIICQLLQISNDEKCDDSQDEVSHEEIFLDEMIETKNDDHEVMEIIP
jgi:hypothetical protein